MRVSLNNDVLLEIFKWFVAVDDDGPYKIFFLSKIWRQTVLGHPDLWSYVTVDTSREDWQERIHVAFLLSQSCPLHLRIRYQNKIHPDLFRFHPGFTRVRTITLQTFSNTGLISGLLDLYTNGAVTNIDKIERPPVTDSPFGAVAIIYNIGIVEWLKAQEWLNMNDQEPPMTDSHPFIRGGILPTKARSVFEVFVEDRRRDKYCCNWAANGQWCRRIFWQRSIAVAHAHIHLNYRPFICHGKCGNEQW
ncbi:hypothetical protein FRC19_005886 [Serendipita sp. 401]|nr:hypothetical protein FRC19_005886 [Serendipita sp. 401]